MAPRLGTERNQCQVIRFDVLPDDVLLDIFDFYTDYTKGLVEAWQTLIHVCRRWRSLVFLSPRRLNLHLCCTPKTRTRDTLDVWPALPITVHGDMSLTSSGIDNIIATLERSNRVCEVILVDLTDRQLEQVSAAMQVPFPELIYLELSSCDVSPVIPDSFLGGFATRLRYFNFNGIPFPGLPNLLLSATHLVELRITDIPHSGYISSEALVALLPVLSSLKLLCLEFLSPQSRSDDRVRPPPPKRSILPSLEHFTFGGISEYFEDLASRIDTPQLDHLRLDLHDQIDFDFGRLAHFINRTLGHRERDNAHVLFDDRTAVVLLGILQISIGCSEPDRQLSSVAQVFSSSIPFAVEDLYIEYRSYYLVWTFENTLWLELLYPFTTTKNLYLAKEFVPGIAAALQALVEERIAGILPNLQNIFVEEREPIEKNIGQFALARQLSGHPVAISDWKKSRT